MEHSSGDRLLGLIEHILRRDYVFSDADYYITVGIIMRMHKTMEELSLLCQDTLRLEADVASAFAICKAIPTPEPAIANPHLRTWPMPFAHGAPHTGSNIMNPRKNVVLLRMSLSKCP